MIPDPLPDRVQDFSGAKAAFFCGLRLLTYLRDDTEGLAWRGMWDLPGGGKEPDESPSDCLLRELDEEFGLKLTPERLLKEWWLPAMSGPGWGVFFYGELIPSELAQIRFGNEGQRWRMMTPDEFLGRADVIPALKERLRLALEWRESSPR